MKRESESSISGLLNWSMLWVAITLIVIGLINLYSAVSSWGGTGSHSLFWSQLVWILVGIVFMLLLAGTDYRIWQSLSWFVYAFSIVLLLLVFVVGVAVHGTYGWLRIGPVSIQPAEIAKLAYLLVAARYFATRYNPDGFGVLELIVPALQMFLPFILIVLAGDLGSALFFVTIFVSLVMFAGLRKITIVILITLVLVSGFGMYKFGLKEYQRSRIMSFMYPEEDVRGRGYHLVQSKIAVGSGKLFGKGYLRGNINKLKYLPERHTDFIFPVFAEEWGFVGGVVVLILFSTFLLMGFETARKARDRFGTFIALGVTSMIFWQVLINLFGVLGLMPLTGVPLPFFSYGGSSMVVMLAAVGLLFSVHRKRYIYA